MSSTGTDAGMSIQNHIERYALAIKPASRTMTPSSLRTNAKRKVMQMSTMKMGAIVASKTQTQPSAFASKQMRTGTESAE